MANSLAAPQLDAVLSRMFDEAARDGHRGNAAEVSWATASAGEKAEAMQDVYMPISGDAGKLLYAMVRAGHPETVIEFGTSFGISTIYLAAAVTDNGTGHVVTTELSPRKAEAARSNLQRAGVGDAVTILVGDARETLRDVPGPVGFALLDGWKDLCLPVLHLLEPKLAPGALVAADDITFESMRSYLDYVRDPAHGYISVEFPVEDGMEISSWTAA
jgi:predicted O-methyltransferase YrrM